MRRHHPKVETGRGKNPLLEQPQLAGAGHGLGAVGSPELVEDVADVLLDRLHRHHQLVGDLAVGAAGLQQPQHCHIAEHMQSGRMFSFNVARDPATAP